MKRSEVKVEDTWNLKLMFAEDSEWENLYQTLAEQVEEFSKWQGHLGDSAVVLGEILQTHTAICRQLSRVYVYATQRADEDTANDFYQSMKQRANRLDVRWDEVASWMSPELMELGEEKIEAMVEENVKLQEYDRFLKNILRMKPHTSSPETEKLLAAASEIGAAPNKIFSMFCYADLKFPDAVDSQGKTYSVTAGSFVLLEESLDRRLRKSAYESFYHTYANFKNSVAAMFASNVQQDAFFAKAKRYASSRAMYLDQNKIPEEVYDNLIQTVHKNVALMHRYVRLRKRMLGVEELHFYDVYAPLVSDFTHPYTFEQAQEIVKAGLAPLGEDYIALLDEAFQNRWIDKYENEGKRNGAYSFGCYDSAPYVLMNFKGNLDHVFTLAHELGHSMHSYYSRRNQPYQYSHYRIFLAEVASTCNEALLNEYLLSKATDKKEKMYLLNHFMEFFKGTLYRQTMFAEFEYLCHQKAWEGETLTASTLCKWYRELNEFYFGPDMVCDDEIAMEWARIPHFYTSFYVYQYSTGFSAAMALAHKILNEGESAVANYKKFLTLGGSVDSIEALKIAGVDMSTSQPIQEALDVFEKMLDEMEELVK